MECSFCKVQCSCSSHVAFQSQDYWILCFLEDIYATNELHAVGTIGDDGAFEFCNALALVKWAPTGLKTRACLWRACESEGWCHHTIEPSLVYSGVALWPNTEVAVCGYSTRAQLEKGYIWYKQHTDYNNESTGDQVYASSPLVTAAKSETAAQSDKIPIETWAEARLEDIYWLEEIDQGHADSIFKLLHALVCWKSTCWKPRCEE